MIASLLLGYFAVTLEFSNEIFESNLLTSKVKAFFVNGSQGEFKHFYVVSGLPFFFTHSSATTMTSGRQSTQNNIFLSSEPAVKWTMMRSLLGP